MTNRTILITGANRGIGLELTEQFAADGWAVLACCRSPDDGTKSITYWQDWSFIGVFTSKGTSGVRIKASSSRSSGSRKNGTSY